jgi:hypothetical protein
MTAQNPQYGSDKLPACRLHSKPNKLAACPYLAPESRTVMRHEAIFGWHALSTMRRA